MTGITLYDALAQAGGAATERLTLLAERLVAGTLADLQRVRELEEHCLAQDWRDAELHGRLTRLIYELYQDWVTEADQVLDLVHPSSGAGGTSIARADELEEACWRIRARLQLTPEQIERAIDQARRGQTIPAEELCKELRALVRA